MILFGFSVCLSKIILYSQYDLLIYVLDTHLRALVKSELRKVNYAAVNNRPDEVYFSRLDSSLKKNTTYVRKLVSNNISYSIYVSVDYSLFLLLL